MIRADIPNSQLGIGGIQTDHILRASDPTLGVPEPILTIAERHMEMSQF